MNKMMKGLAGIMVAASIVGGASAANAGGFFGDLVEGACGGCGAGRALDKLNKDAGNPVDHAGAIFADGVIPGSGAAMEAYWAMRRARDQQAQQAGAYDGQGYDAGPAQPYAPQEQPQYQQGRPYAPQFPQVAPPVYVPAPVYTPVFVPPPVVNFPNRPPMPVFGQRVLPVAMGPGFAPGFMPRFMPRLPY